MGFAQTRSTACFLVRGSLLAYMKRGFFLRNTKLPTEHVSPDGTATEHASISTSTHNTPFAAGSYTEEAAVGCDMSIICASDQETLVRPCVDCGQMTGRFCDYCYAADRCPDERWAPNQLTPLCCLLPQQFVRAVESGKQSSQGSEVFLSRYMDFFFYFYE